MRHFDSASVVQGLLGAEPQTVLILGYPLLERIQAGEIDPSFVVTHHLPLEQALDGYRMFRDKEDECIKVVLRP